MKQNLSTHCAGLLLALQLIVVTTTGCNKDGAEPLNSLRHANVRSELKDNFRSAFDNLTREAKSSSSLKGAFDNVQRLLKIDLGDSLGLPNLDGLNAEFLGTVIDKVLESDLAQSLFSETNIASRTDSEVIYIIDRGMCDKFAGFTSSKATDEKAISTCKRFLEKNALELHVKSQGDKGLELELWHSAIATGVPAKKFVASLIALPNSIGSRINLDGAKDFATAVFDLQPKDAASPDNMSVVSLPVEQIKKLKGMLSLAVRFKSDKSPSGCQNNERLCLVANVDEDIEGELGGQEVVQFSLAHSAKEKPSVTIAANADNGFTGTFNLGAFDGQAGSTHLFVEASQFQVILPELKNDSEFKFTLENFRPGPRPSTFEGSGKKIVLDLKNDSRVIEKFQFSKDSNKMLVQMSPFKLLLSFSDDSDESCKSFESILFSNNANEATTVQFLSASDSSSTFASHPGRRKVTSNRHFFFRSNDSDEPICDASNLMAHRILMGVNVSSEHCNDPGMVAVTQGSLALTYKYHVNNEEEKDISVSVNAGQCLVP